MESSECRAARVRNQVSSGPPSSASTNPASVRPRVSAPRERGSRCPWAAAAWLTMCTSMSPLSRTMPAPMPGPGQRRGQLGAARGADDQLRGVGGARELDQRGRHVLADHLVVAAAEAFDEQPLVGQHLGVRGEQPVGGRDVHGGELPAAAARGDARPAAQQRLALLAAGQRDHDAFAGFPARGDPVFGPVLFQRRVDLVGQPEQRDLAQRGQVAEPEVVGQRRVDAPGRVDQALAQPGAQRLRGQVDQLDRVRGPQHGIGDGLALGGPGDVPHHVARGTRCAAR